MDATIGDNVTKDFDVDSIGDLARVLYPQMIHVRAL